MTDGFPSPVNTNQEAWETSAGSASRKRPAPRGTAAYPRKRGNTACQVCRARRTKCDNGVPSCSFCLKTGAACIRSPVDLSSFDPASIQILERIEELNQSFRRWCADQPIQRQTSEASLNPRPTKDHETKAWLFPSTPEDVLPSETRGEPLLAILKGRVDRLSGALSATSPVSAFADLNPQSVNILIDNFFEHVHVKNPILDEHVARSMVGRLALHGVDWSPQSCLALLICALGAIANPLSLDPSMIRGLSSIADAESYFLAAQRRLGSCFVEGGLIQAQCLFLAGVYLMTIFKPVQAWRMFSQSLACCQDFTSLNNGDLEDDGTPDTPEDFGPEQAVYWSAWKSEQELRWDLKPLDFCSQQMRQLEFPKFFPAPALPADTDTDSHVKAWNFYLTEISLRRQSIMLAADITESVGQLSHIEIEKLMRMLPGREAQIEHWLSQISEPMSLRTPPEEDDICKFILRGHHMNLYEMLYWPFLCLVLGMIPATDPGQERRMEQTLDLHLPQLKVLAEKALEYHAQRIRVNKPGFLHRHHGTWFMIRSCCRSATMLLMAALHNDSASATDAMLTLPGGWGSAVVQVVELHRHWKLEASDISFRLNALESLMAQVTVW